MGVEKRKKTVPSGRLIAYRVDRLGARLNCLVNARRLGLKFDMPFRMHWFWTPTGYDSSEINDPTDLFDKDFVDEHFIPMEAWREAQRGILKVGDLTGKPGSFSHRQLQDGRDILIDWAFGIVRFADETEEEATLGFRDAMDGIPFAPALRKHQERIAQVLNKATAYHIRRGDLTTGIRTKHSPWPHKCVPDEFYLHHMATETARDQKVILFSDDDATLRRFKAEFPDTLLFKDLVDREGLSVGARDLLELYSMSRCSKIVAPEQSAFSSTAAALGAANKIDIVEDLSPSTRHLACSDLLDRLKSQPESFANEGEVAQMLVQLQDWCVANDRLVDLVALQKRHIAGQSTIAFVFPMLMRNQLVIGDAQGTIESGRIMDLHPVPHDKSLAEAEALRSLAFAAIGDRDSVSLHISRALSITPLPANVRKLTAAYLTSGHLTPQNFLPVPEEILALRQSGFKDDKDQDLHEVIGKTLGLQERRHIVALDPVFLDWEDLFGKTMVKGILRKDRHEPYLQDRKDLRTPEGQAFALGLLARLSDDRRAANDLVDLSQANPDRAYVHFQVARTYLHSRERKLAFVAISRACEIAPDVPSYAFIGADLAYRTRQPELAIQWHQQARSGLPGFLGVHIRAAECLLALGDEARALEAARWARSIDPVNSAAGALEAKILRRTGHGSQARAVLEELARIDRLTKQTFTVLAEIYLEMGEFEKSRAAVERGLERDADFQPLVDLKLKLDDLALPN